MSGAQPPLEKRIDQLLESLAHQVDDAPPPESDRVSVVWGWRGGRAHMALESRARYLAEAWDAIHEHDTWGELRVSVSDPVATWLGDVLAEILSWNEMGPLTDHSEVDFLASYLEDDETEVWPWLGADQELKTLMDGLTEEGRRAMGEAFHADEITSGTSITTGELWEVAEPEEVQRRLRGVYVNCYQDDELIQKAAGPFT